MGFPRAPNQPHGWQEARGWRGPQPSPATLAPKNARSHSPSHTLNRRRMAAGGAPHAPLWREEREQSGPTPSRVETQPSYSPTPTRKARVASCGSGSCGGASRTCRRTFGDRSPQCRHARPGQLSPGLLGDEGPTAMPQPPQQQGANGSSPPWRAPPPASHLREIQVENAKGCPLDFTALPPELPLTQGLGWGRRRRGL